MIRSYLVVSLRTLWKHRSVTAINVLGLAAGMAVCLLVGLLIWDQTTHDDFHPGADRMYRITTERQNNSAPFAASPAGLAPILRQEVAGVEAATRLRRTNATFVHAEQGHSANALYAEAQFFDVFGFELAAGRSTEALNAPYTAVITADLAQRVYNTTDVVGNTFRSNGALFTITGVIDRAAYRSHLDFDVLYAFATLQQTRSDELASDWDRGYAYYTYVRLAPGTPPAALDRPLRAIEAQHLPPPTAGGTVPLGFQLQAVADLPFSEILPNEIAQGMLPASAGYFFVALALLVLLAAGFNYVNLSTARSLTRAREVGVRKAVGASQGQVIGQFLAEAILVALLALGGAVIALQGLVPLFNQLSVVAQLDAQIDVVPGLMLYGAFVLFALAVGLGAGFYPAWYLSRFQPARVAEARGGPGAPKSAWLAPRKVLIVLQFAVALVVMGTTVLVYQQAQHLSGTQPGIETENRIHIDLQEASARPFQQQARRVPGVVQVGLANTVPLSGTTWNATLQRAEARDSVSAIYYATDFAFIDAVGVNLQATDGWSASAFESGQAVLINAGAATALGFDTPTDALGAPITVTPDNERSVRVAGIIQNFHTRYSDAASEPAVFHYNPARFQVALAQLVANPPAPPMEALAAAWGQFDKANPPSLRAYDELTRARTGANALSEVSEILALVAGMALLISCLGLLGIALYTVQTRVQEIGIRKALGASVASIVGELARDFLLLIGVAVGVGLPLAWWINTLWLSSFAYRIEMGWAPLTLSAAALLALALLAIGPQTLRAARLDPAITLRDE